MKHSRNFLSSSWSLAGHLGGNGDQNREQLCDYSGEDIGRLTEPADKINSTSHHS
jgi:hypothetical protein